MSRSTVAVAPLVVCAVAYAPGQTQTNGAELLTVAANGYRANLEAFEQIMCRYTITWGFANSLDDALAGRLQPGSRTATAVIYKDGNVLRFRIEEDPKTKSGLDKNPGPQKGGEIGGLKGGPFVPFMTTDYLLSETRGLLFNPRGHTANIYDARTKKGKEVDPYFLLTPLRANTKYDFGLLADQASRGEIPFTFGPAAEDGTVKTTFQVSKNHSLSFTVDLTRGSLPTRIDNLYDEGASFSATTVVPQIRACSEGRWFPERIVSFAKQSPTQSPCLVKDYKVVELDVDHRPPQEALTVELPAGTVICQFDDSRKYFKTRRPERVGADNLDRIYHLTEEVPRTPQTDTTIVLPRRNTWIWYVAGGVAVLLGLAYFGRRFLGARRSDATH